MLTSDDRRALHAFKNELRVITERDRMLALLEEFPGWELLETDGRSFVACREIPTRGRWARRLFAPGNSAASVRRRLIYHETVESQRRARRLEAKKHDNDTHEGEQQQ